ncbi:unnamed protein product [Closterium sp. Yama58-4]|nr:unnamed protein product [Closterium sp. Yama58-4]
MIAISSRHHGGHRHHNHGDAGYGDRVAAGDRLFDLDRVFDGGWPAVATSDDARYPTSSSHHQMQLHPPVNLEFHARREDDRAADGSLTGFERDARPASLVEEASDSSSTVTPQFRFHGALQYQHRQVDASTTLLPLDGKIPSLRVSPVAAPSRQSAPRATNEAVASSVSSQPALADLAASQSITIGCLVPVDLTPDSVHMLAAVTLAVGEINLSKSLLPNHTLLLAPLNYTTQPVAGQMAGASGIRDGGGGHVGGMWVACGWHVGGMWVACGWHVGGMWVACGWHVGGMWMACGWHVGGMWVACGWHVGGMWMACGWHGGMEACGACAAVDARGYLDSGFGVHPHPASIPASLP